MPSDSFFGFSVLVAGRPVPEYVQRGRVYVESSLHTPFSYNQQMEELVNGEKEVQSTPVTPYQVFIHLAPHCETSVLFIYVDGVRVTKLLLEKGQSKIIGGFEDKNGVREFLFALPRFAVDKEDTVDEKRKSKIGTIEIVRCEASYVKEEYRPKKDINFNQANKKDAFKVTAGKYTMSTTKKGRYIHRSAPYDVQLKKLWRLGRECGRLCVNYRMGHSLEEMGVQLRPTDWSRVIVRKSSDSPPNSPLRSPAASSPAPSPTGTSPASSPAPSPTGTSPASSPAPSPTGKSPASSPATKEHSQCTLNSRSSSPTSPSVNPVSHHRGCSSHISFTSTEIKQEMDTIEPIISPIQVVTN